MTGLANDKFLKSLHISPRLNAVYVNNPKVACSTIKLALQRAEAQVPDWQPRTSVHDHAASPLLTWPALTMDNWTANLADRFVFSFVRNPFARLRSAYLNKVYEPQKKGIHRVRAGFDADYRPSFDEFVAAVCDTDPLQHDAHWRPQSLNLSVGRITFDYVGRLEQFSDDWGVIAKCFDLPHAPERSGKSTAEKSPGSLLFSHDLKQRVFETYEGDFNAFDYDPDQIP